MQKWLEHWDYTKTWYHGAPQKLDRAVAVEIWLNTDPRHLSALRMLFGTDNRNVVFSVAGGNARRASSAFVEIDSHRPPVGFVLWRWVESTRLVAVLTSLYSRRMMHVVPSAR